MRILRIAIFLQFILTLKLHAQEMETNLQLQDIRCHGNIIISCENLKSRLFLKIGEPIDEIEIQNAKLRMRSFYQLQSADIVLEKGNSPGQAVVLIQVIEVSPWTKHLSAGLTMRGPHLSERVTGEVQYNNFLNSGKILSLNVDQQNSLSAQTPRIWYTRLQYIDPNLFGSQKWFLTGGLSYLQYEVRGTSLRGNEFNSQSEKLVSDLNIGYRFDDSSFISFGVFDTPMENQLTAWKRYSDGTHETDTSLEFSRRQGVSVAYGWNTEDDSDFATKGSQFIASLGIFRPEGAIYGARGGLFYKTTWKDNAENIWSFKAGFPNQFEKTAPIPEDVGASLTLARDGKGFRSSLLGDVSRTRKYVEAGYFLSAADPTWVPGIKVGYKMDTKNFGVMNFYLFALAENQSYGYR